MTAEQLENRINDIEIAMRGDLKGNPGIMQNMIRMMNDMYQEPESFKLRIHNLEAWKTNSVGRVDGVLWAFRILWILLGVVGGVLLKILIK